MPLNNFFFIPSFGIISTARLTNLNKSVFGAKQYSSYILNSYNFSDFKFDRKFRQWLGGFIDGFGSFSDVVYTTYTLVNKQQLYLRFKLSVENKDIFNILHNRYGGSLSTHYKGNGSGYTIYKITEAKGIKSFLYDINGFLRNPNPISILEFNDMCSKFNIKSLYLNKSFKQEPLNFQNAWLAGLVDSRQSSNLIKLTNNSWELYWIITVFNWGNYSLSSVNGISKYGGQVINNTLNFSDKYHQRDILNLKHYFNKYSLDSYLKGKMSLVSEILDTKRILHYNNPSSTKGYLAVLKLTELSKKL